MFTWCNKKTIIPQLSDHFPRVDGSIKDLMIRLMFKWHYVTLTSGNETETAGNNKSETVRILMKFYRKTIKIQWTGWTHAFAQTDTDMGQLSENLKRDWCVYGSGRRFTVLLRPSLMPLHVHACIYGQSQLSWGARQQQQQQQAVVGWKHVPSEHMDFFAVRPTT